MAIFTSDSSSISTLVVSRSFIATSSIQFVTNSLHIDYGLGQGGSMSFASFTSITTGNIITASHAEGLGSIAFGSFNHVEGEKNITNNNNHKFQHVEGFNNTSSGQTFPIHIEGHNNTYAYGAAGKYGHIEGINNRLGSSTYGHIEGFNNSASSVGGNFHVEGVNNYSILNSQNLQNSHIKGIRNYTWQIDYSHIKGVNNNAASQFNRAIHVGGSGSTAERGYYYHIEGEMNFHRAVNASNHIKGFNNRIDSSSYNNNIRYDSPQATNLEGANNSASIKAWGRISGISHSFYPPIAILNTTFNSQSLAAVFSSGFNLRTYNTASEYIYMFGKFNSGLSTGVNTRVYSYITIGGGENDSNRANIMEIITNVSGTMGSLPPPTAGGAILYNPSSSYIVLPGLKAYANNAAALAAGVPVGGLYIGKQSGDPEANTVFIAT